MATHSDAAYPLRWATDELSTVANRGTTTRGPVRLAAERRGFDSGADGTGTSFLLGPGVLAPQRAGC